MWVVAFFWVVVGTNHCRPLWAHPWTMWDYIIANYVHSYRTTRRQWFVVPSYRYVSIRWTCWLSSAGWNITDITEVAKQFYECCTVWLASSDCYLDYRIGSWFLKWQHAVQFQSTIEQASYTSLKLLIHNVIISIIYCVWAGDTNY